MFELTLNSAIEALCLTPYHFSCCMYLQLSSISDCQLQFVLFHIFDATIALHENQRPNKWRGMVSNGEKKKTANECNGCFVGWAWVGCVQYSTIVQNARSIDRTVAYPNKYVHTYAHTIDHGPHIVYASHMHKSNLATGNEAIF